MIEGFYKAFFDGSRLPTLYVVSGKVRAANAAALKLFSKTFGVGELADARFRALWPRGTKAPAKGAITKLKGLKTGRYELTVGADIELVVDVKPVGRGKRGRVVTVEDVTDRNRYVRELLEREKLYQAFTEEALVGVYIYRENRFLYVNDEMAAITGYSKEELLSIDTDELVDPCDRKFLSEREKARKKGRAVPSRYTMRIRRKNGEPAILLVGTRPIDYRGRRAYLGNCTDVTENVRAREESERLQEEVLAAMREREALFDGAGVLLWSIKEADDGKLYYESVNAAFAAVEGYTPEHYAGKAIDELHTPEECSRIWNTYEWAKLGRIHTYDVCFGSGRDRRFFIIRVIPLPDRHGKIRRFIASGTDVTERKETENELREIAEKYITLQSNIPVGVFRTSADPGGRLFSANPALARMFGYESPEEMADVRVVDLYANPKDRKLFRDTIKAEGEIADYEVEFRRRDGKTFWGSLSARAISDAKGKPLFFDGILEDITERKRAERALRESEERYRRLVEYNPAGIAIHCEGKTVYANEAGIKIIGAAKEEDVLGKPVLDFLHPDYHEAVRTRIKAVQEKGVTAEPAEEKFLRLDGRTVDVEVAAIPTLYKGKPAVQVVFWDITERKQAAEALRESEEKYRTLQENLPVAVFRSLPGEGGRLLSANPALARMFGYKSPEDVSEAKVVDFYADPRDRDKFLQTIMSEGEITAYEVEFRRRDGTTFWGSLYASVVRDAAGEVMYIDGIIEDITARKEALSSLSESEKKYRALYDTTKVLSIYADTEEVLRSVGEQAAILLDAYDCTIYTYDRDAGLLTPKFTDSEDYAEEILSLKIPFGVGVVGQVAETGEGVIINADTDPAERPLPGVPGAGRGGSVIAAPLKAKGTVEGVIILSRLGEHFYPTDLDALHAFSAQAAVALERARLMEELRASGERYRTTLEGTGTAITLLEEDTTISFANKGFELLSGYRRDEVEGRKSWTEFVATYELERMKRYHEERRRPGGEAPTEYEFDFKRRDGAVRRVFASITLIPGTAQSVASLIDITDLRRAEERYRTTVESTGTAIALLEESGKISFVNREMERLAGAPREELEGKATWQEFVVSEYVPILRRYEEELRAGGEMPANVEFGFQSRDGSVRNCLLSAALLPGTTTLVVSVIDITERKRAEDAVKKHYARTVLLRGVVEKLNRSTSPAEAYKAALDGLKRALKADRASVLVFETDGAPRFKAWDGLSKKYRRAVEGYFPWGADDTEAEPFCVSDVLDGGLPDEVREAAVTEGIRACAFFPIVGEGTVYGRFVAYFDRPHVLAADDVDLGKLLASNLSATIRRFRDRDAMQESEEKYRALFEHAADAVFLETLDGKILEVNHQACDMLGYTREELVSMTVADLTPPEIACKLAEIAAELKEKGILQIEAVNLKKDRTSIPVELSARLVEVGGREVVLAIVRDISEYKEFVEGLRRQADELLELKRAKETLTDLVVHDIKNISSGMLVWLELLQDGVFGPITAEQTETVARVMENNTKLFELSQELLDIARSEEGEIKLQKRPLLLDRTAAETVEHYRPTAEKQSKTLLFEARDEPVLVYADADRIQRVISNLIANGLKFVEPKDGCVRVTVCKGPEGKEAVVRVEDNGRGIPEDYHELIFEKFRQVELRDAGFKRGAGLGLTFCKMVVTEHGGNMWVESDGEHGSTFVFTLPLYR